VKNILADLKQKLEVRYELNLKKCNDKLELMEVEMDESKVPNNDIGLKLPEIPAEDISLSSDNDNFISCDKLYNLIQKIRARYLIIDTRQKGHYENSRILSDRCINIPQSEIKKGYMKHFHPIYIIYIQIAYFLLFIYIYYIFMLLIYEIIYFFAILL